MNKEYIERKSLIKDCDAIISNIQFTSPYQDDIDAMVNGMERIRDMIDEAPAADVAPVVHGEWVKTPYIEVKRCSCCNAPINIFKEAHIYCSTCGAKMDGGNE